MLGKKNASSHLAFTHPAFLPGLPAWRLRQFLTLRENTEYSSVAICIILLFGQPRVEMFKRQYIKISLQAQVVTFILAFGAQRPF
jgi:hypothetical protein